jgi:hypothetical protein
VVVTSESDRLTGVTAREAVRRRWNLTVRRARESEMSGFFVLCLASAFLGAAMSQWPDAVPISALIVPMVIGSLVLGPRSLPWFVVFALGCVVVVVAATADKVIAGHHILDGRRVGGIVVEFAVGLIILVASFRRSRLGVAGTRGESMLVDLRDRITKQGQLPELPEGWYVEFVVRSAGGSSFAGDFMVAAKSRDETRLQVAVVDVSGKGEQAGTRSLLLSGAFGGLLGALPAARFLPAANEYLLQQDWSEGFATAVHLSLDLTSGDFALRSAGHPPAVQLRTGSGRWVIHEGDGPVLGLMADAQFARMDGTLQRGDALLLYTDGLVETPQRDISLGIDKLVGQAERLLRGNFEHGARRLIDRLESMNDDRALLLLHRR